jgi:hypothetical protein
MKKTEPIENNADNHRRVKKDIIAKVISQTLIKSCVPSVDTTSNL